MNIVYFFTYGYSLKVWKDSGQLEREIFHFESLKKKNPDMEFTLVTYGNEEDLNLIEKNFIKVVPIYNYLPKSNYKVINFINSFFYIKKIKKFIKIDKTTIIIQNQLLGSWISNSMKKITNSPFVIRTGYDMYEFSLNENKNILKKYFFKHLTKLSLKQCDIYTVTSKCDRDFLLKKFKNLQTSKIKIRPNWVSVKTTIVPSKERNKSKIVCVGRLESQKNYFDIVNSIKNTNFELDIYGEGSQKSILIDFAKKLGVKVNFLGVINNKDLQKKLQNYKFYLTASKFEGNPKSVLEAMAAGCIVIASNIKNHREFLNNQNSLLFNDSNELNKLLFRLDKNDVHFNNIVKNSLTTITKKYNIDLLVENELSDYESLFFESKI